MPGPSAQERTEIYELYARYSWALDTGDTDGSQIEARIEQSWAYAATPRLREQFGR